MTDFAAAFDAAPEAPVQQPADGFDPDAFLRDFEAAPNADTQRTDWPYGYSPDMPSVPVTADLVAPSGQLTWTEEARRPDYVTTDAYRERYAAENDAIRQALIAAGTKGVGDKMTAYQVAQALGLHVAEVQQNLEAFRAAAVASKADPDAFRRQAPPELVRLVLRNPTLASNLVETKTGGELSNFLRGLATAAWEGITHLGSGYAGASDISLESGSAFHQAAAAEEVLRQEKAYQQIASGWVTEDVPLTFRFTSKEEAQAWLDKHEDERAQARLVVQKFEDSRKEKVVKQVDDTTAQAARESGTVVSQRYAESDSGLEASRLRYFRMMASLGGASPDELLDYDTRIHDLELDAQPRYLGEGELGQLAGEATQGVSSTVGMLPQMGASTIAGMSIGALGGAILAKRVGAPLAAGARAGAMAMAGPSALVGAAEASFYVEAGSTQKDLSEALTDKGEHLTEAEIAGGSLLAGALKAGLEVLEVNAVAKTFGPTRGLLATNARKEVADLLTKDPRFRAIVARAAAQWLKSSAEEGLEEGFQTATDNAVAYLVKSIKDRELQKGAILDKEDIGQSMVAGAAGGLAMGSVGTTTQLVGGALQARSAARVETQVKQVLQLAQHEASQQAPAEVAQAAMEASAKAGIPVTALHVDGMAAQRFFQERSANEAEARAQAEEAFGPGGAEKVAEAAATGGFVEVPMEEVLGRYGRTDAAKTLAADTTTHPALLTPRQLAEGGLARIEAEARRVAEEIGAREKEAAVVDERTKALQRELVAAGMSKDQAKAGAALVRSFMETQAKDFEQPVAAVFPETPISVARGDEASAIEQAAATTPPVQQDGTDAAPKGYAELQPDRGLQSTIRVFLNRSADVSTVVHESAHAFLEHLLDLAERPDAPQRTRDTALEALKALGAESRKQVSRQHHEAFARAFEAYAFEGKAPSAGLRKAFARFARWLTGIYRSLRGVPGANLSPHLRSVFDAMLATEEQLAALRRAQGPSLTAEQLRVSPEERAAQLEAEAADYAEASHAAQLQAVKDALRVRKQWWKAAMAKLRTQFSEEYENLPGRRAQRLLEGELTGKPVVLERAAVEAVIGKARARGLRTAEEGVSPAQVAEAGGFPNAAVMLSALAGLRPKGPWVEAAADAEVRRMFPGILDDLSRFKRELAGGLHDATERRLLREWKGLPAPLLRRTAQLLVEGRTLARLRPSQALRQQRSAAEEKARAAAKGDIARATDAARRELLNHYLYRELLKAEGEVESASKLLSRMSKPAARSRLGKASPNYRDAVEVLLHPVNGKHAMEDVSVLKQAIADMNADAVLVGDPDWLGPVVDILAGGTPWEALTVSQMRALIDAVKNISAAATQRNTVILDGKRADLDAVVADLVKEAKENKRQRSAVSSSTSAESLASKLANLPGVLSAPLLKIETMVDWLGGSLLGKSPRASVWYRAIFKPLESARQREADLQKRIAEPIIKAWESMPKTVRESMQDAFDGAAFFPSHAAVGSSLNLSAPTRRFELLMMALNSGNASNLQRLLDGRNITFEQLTRALDTLSREEIEWVNSVGAAFETMWPEIQAMEERLTGVKPEGLERRPLVLSNGTIAGHYFPAIYDRRFGRAGAKQADAIASLFHPTVGRPATLHSHTKSRVESFVGVIQLEPSAVMLHLSQEIHDLAFRERVMSAARLLLDERVQDVLKSSLGQARAAQFIPWLRDVAQLPGLDGADAAGFFMSLAAKLKANTTIAALGYSIPNFYEDFSALPAAAFDREVRGRFLASGLFEFLTSPLSKIREVEERSALMRASNDALYRDLGATIKKLTASGPLARGPLAFLKEHAFALIEASFKATATPIWLGRYQQALAAGESQADAVDAADKTIRRLFPQHSAANAAGIIRSKSFIGFSLQFFGFFNTAGNVVMDNLQMVREAPPEAKLRAAGRILGYMVAISLIGAALRGRGPDEDEEPEAWAARMMIAGSISLLPFGSDLANFWDALARGQRPTVRPSFFGAVAMGLTEAGLAFSEGRSTGQQTAAVLRAAGPLLGVPTSQPARSLKYAVEVNAGERQPANAIELAGGLQFGESNRREWNLFRWMGHLLFSEQ